MPDLSPEWTDGGDTELIGEGGSTLESACMVPECGSEVGTILYSGHGFGDRVGKEVNGLVNLRNGLHLKVSVIEAGLAMT